MEKYGKIDSKAKALDYAIRDYELNTSDKVGFGYEIPDKEPRQNYLSNDSWKSFLKGMCPLHKAQFNDGDGSELWQKKGRYGIYPPKMASFGSSSRLIYRLSKDIDGFCFEKALPTRVGHTANLDGYCIGNVKDIYVEAKCREIYVSHKNNKISDVYKSVYNRIAELHPCFHYDFSPLVDDYSSITFYYDKKCIEHFDIKQLICHFLGISANILDNNANRNVSFVYLIFNPQFGTDFKSSSKVEKYYESVNETYNETIAEIERLGDMKWLFDAVMRFQCEHLEKDSVDYDFSFCFANQNNYKNFF